MQLSISVRAVNPPESSTQLTPDRRYQQCQQESHAAGYSKGVHDREDFTAKRDRNPNSWLRRAEPNTFGAGVGPLAGR